MTTYWFLVIAGGIALIFLFLKLLEGIFPIKTKNKQLSKLSSDNPQLKYEMEVYRALVNDGLRANDTMLETQREHIAGLQKLDRAFRNEKRVIEVQNFKMVKSIETFNLCCELISRNPILMDMLLKRSEDEGVEILRQTINLNDIDFNNCKNSLKQIVCCVKEGKLIPFKNY
jgi:hypothetical protein